MFVCGVCLFISLFLCFFFFIDTHVFVCVCACSSCVCLCVYVCVCLFDYSSFVCMLVHLFVGWLVGLVVCCVSDWLIVFLCLYMFVGPCLFICLRV